jgi:DNA-binding NarL/FixJ family response regulator
MIDMEKYLKKYSILIVDDNPVFVRALKDLIEDHLAERLKFIDISLSGMEGMKKIKEKRYDYIFMDIDMPDMNGIQITKMIDREVSRLKIIAVSFHKEMDYIQGMLSAGARNYITKDSLNAESLARIFNI